MSPAPPVEAALLLAAIALSLASGLPTLVRRDSEGAARLGALLAVGAGLAALAAAILGLAGRTGTVVDAAWPLPFGRLVLAVDPLSAAFLVPVSVVFPLASVYGLGYERGGANAAARRRTIRLFSGALAASIVVVTVARDGVVFLLAWEAMALSAFFLVTVEHEEAGIRRAGWTYLATTHVGTLALVAMVLLLRQRGGGLAWLPLPEGPAGTDAAILLLALVGFGAKAGLAPLHFWLPGAHAGAPSHVSALLSAVMLKTGLYGILRVSGLLPHVPVPLAALVLLAGAVTALLGVALAAGQADVKRVLAYSSVENVGIVAMGIGLALSGRAAGRPEWVLLGVAAAVFHTWVHALFKAALFLGAGSVVHATGTRAVDRLGGLLRRMPATGTAFVAGAAAAAVLPPFGGFAAEWLLYAGLLRAFLDPAHGLLLAPVGVATLALAGALAVTAFVRLAGTVLLGEPRSAAAERAHESPRTMTAPAILAAAAAAAAGLALPFLAPALERVASSWGGGSEARLVPTLAEAAALGPLTALLSSLAACVLVAALLVALAFRRRVIAGRPTWDCGYAAPSATMQYTARSFSTWVAERLAPPLLGVRTSPGRPSGLFPARVGFDSSTPEPVGERLLEPALSRAADRLGRLRRFQHGRLSSYLVVPVATLVVLLLWNALRAFWRLP